MILKQLKIKDYGALWGENEINFNTTGMTVLYGDFPDAISAALCGINGALYGETDCAGKDSGQSLRAVLGYDGKELITRRWIDEAGNACVKSTLFGFREDSVTERHIENIIATHHSPVCTGDLFCAPLSLTHFAAVLEAKIGAAHLEKKENYNPEELLTSAKKRMKTHLEKYINQTILQFRYLCDDNDVDSWEKFEPITVADNLTYKIPNEAMLNESERYLYQLLLFLGEVEAIRKIFSKNYCDFILLDHFLQGVEDKYIPAAAYFLARFRQQAIVGCSDAVMQKLEPLLPVGTVCYHFGNDNGKCEINKICNTDKIW